MRLGKTCGVGAAIINMWFTIIKIKPLTGKGAIKSKAKNIVTKYLSTVEIGRVFLAKDVLDYAQVNSLKGVKHVTVKNLGHQLRINQFVEPREVDRSRGSSIKWIKVR